MLENPTPKYMQGEVEVKETPRPSKEEEDKKKLIKLDFNSIKPDDELISILLKGMHEASI